MKKQMFQTTNQISNPYENGLMIDSLPWDLGFSYRPSISHLLVTLHGMIQSGLAHLIAAVQRHLGS